jgi:hypothetical protein
LVTATASALKYAQSRFCSVCHEIPFHLSEVPRRIRDKSAERTTAKRANMR